MYATYLCYYFSVIYVFEIKHLLLTGMQSAI